MVFFLKEKNLLYKQVLIIFFHSTTGRNFERANIFTYWLTRRKSLLLFFLHQPLVDQKFVARTNVQEYLLWDYLKYSYDYDLNFDLMHTNPTVSKVFFMQCELDDTEPYFQYLDWRAMVYSSCDLNFSHHNLTVAVTEYYQQN